MTTTSHCDFSLKSSNDRRKKESMAKPSPLIVGENGLGKTAINCLKGPITTS